MKYANNNLVAIIVCVQLIVSAASSQVARSQSSTPAFTSGEDQLLVELSQSRSPFTLWQARQIIVKVLLLRSSPFALAADIGSFTFNFDDFEFNATDYRRKESLHYKVDLKSLPLVVANRGSAGVYRLKDEAGHDLPEPFKRLWWNDQRAEQNSEALAKALNRLREMAGEQGMVLRNYPQAAEAWRAQSPKPPIPEEVRAQTSLAEAAYNAHKLPQALYHYERGVELYPMWPAGHFNAALVSAELNLFDDAIQHMRDYLQLVPDSRDAQEAQDIIATWQDKATQQAAAASQGQSQPSGKKRLGGFAR